MTSWRARDAAVTEWLDAGKLDHVALNLNLRDIRRINALLGWTAFTTRGVLSWMRREPHRQWTLLDVASGSADIPISIARAAASSGLSLNVTATDRNPAICAIARELGQNTAAFRVELQDALDLPYVRGQFDIALCTLAMHHFEPDAAVSLLASMAQVARRIFVYDVVRSRVAYAGVIALTSVTGMSAMTRHDGAASVRRAYSRTEAQQIAERAGLRNIHTRVLFPYRLALAADGVCSEGCSEGGADAL
ncbi:MAG TPA: methyltransferase domain-containing protein [Ktedonobacterales bacterium]